MRFILFLTFFLLAGLLFVQADECFCYENSDTGFAEWLIFEKDSVVILTRRNKTCADEVRGIKTIDDGGFKNFKYPYVEDEGELYIVKKVEIPQFNTGMSMYYSGFRKNKDLEVHITYTNSFQDMVGPPDRLYKGIAVK